MRREFFSSEFPGESQESTQVGRGGGGDRPGVVLLCRSISQASYMGPVISFEFQNKRNSGKQRRKHRAFRDLDSDDHYSVQPGKQNKGCFSQICSVAALSSLYLKHARCCCCCCFNSKELVPRKKSP